MRLVALVKADPVLSSVLGSVGLDQPIQAVLTFDHYPTATELLAIRATGVHVRRFGALQMVGAQGTSLQIRLRRAEPAYERHEVGAGYLNAYDAVRSRAGAAD